MSRGPVEQIRGPGIWAGYWADRGAVPILVGSGNVHVLVTLECVVCVPSLVNFSLNQLKSRMGTWLSVLMFYVSPIHRCC